MLLNRLEGKGLVTAAEFREPESRERRIEISFPPDAASLLADLETARQDYAAARLAGFSPEERAQYERLAGRVQDNISGTGCSNAAAEGSEGPSSIKHIRSGLPPAGGRTFSSAGRMPAGGQCGRILTESGK